MKSYLFQLKCSSGDLSIDTMRADTYPKAGDHLTIFNFPVVERYVIERLDARPEWWARDHYGQMALIVRLDSLVQTAANTGNVIAFNQYTNLETRLAKIEKVARKAIDTSLLLEISSDDFKALCTGSGLSVEIEDIDAFAYHDIPIKLGEAGEWNAATAFTGYSDDRHVLYVTCPGGTPFEMNTTLLEVSKLFYEFKLSTEMALARVMAEAVDRGCAETSGLQNAMRNTLGLMQDGVMPMYDGAQELTRMTHPAYAATLSKM